MIPGIVQRLQLLASRPVHVATALGAGTARLFWVRLDFPVAGLDPFELVQVARLAVPPELALFHGVLGRDLLRRLESFDYEGRRGRYTVRDRPGPFGWLRPWL